GGRELPASAGPSLAAGSAAGVAEPVGRPRSDHFAVLAEGGSGDRVLMARKRSNFLAALRVPQLENLVAAAGDDVLAIRAVGDCGDGGLVACQVVELLAGCRVPDFDDAIGAGGCDLLAVRAEDS